MREYSHIKSESLAQIRTILAEVKKFFLREIVFNRRILHTDYNDVAVVVCKSHYMQLTASAPRCIYANVSTCRRQRVVHRWMLVARRRRLRTLEAGLASS